ncbi:MAG TPA: HD domain-containing phosphohydrolase [Gemmatimonadaceae bacterium]|nr:HD domain-containing phosphohydrolase [Gemmatimonadaceae bacterium]
MAFSVGTAAGAGAFAFRERRNRTRAERLGAATLETLLNAIEANDAETGAHVRRVAAYSLVLGQAADLDERMLHAIERVALFHDIGKLHEAVTDIFHDVGKLTPDERLAVMTHPIRGAQVLEPLAAFYPELPKGVAAHHERWDGTGYPRGLKGKRIPLTARLVAITDSFDAITHQRRYAHAKSFKEAATAIAAGRGTQFDPELVDLFLSPPVLADIERESRRANGPKTTHRNRRRGESQKAPDLIFRWRQPKGSSRLPDRIP